MTQYEERINYMAKPKQNDPVLNELRAIKKLLILALYADDVPSEEINKAVKIGAANIRGMFSKKKLKKAMTSGGDQ